MKFNKMLFFVTFSVALLFYGCQQKSDISINNENSKLATEKASIEENVDKEKSIDNVEEHEGLVIEALAEYNALALTFEELYSDADLVLELKVKTVDSFIEEQTGSILSNVIPEVVHIYKGEYNGKPIQVVGGKMNYNEYMSNEIIKEKLEGREDPNPNAEKAKHEDVLFIMDNGYIYEAGDRYFFFGKEYEDENFIRPLYAYQSSFKVENQTVSNKAIQEDEPLFTDIKNVFSVNSKQSNSTLENGEPKVGINKNAFEDMLNGLKD
ncbi:hypothetical protein [Bacillus niameyensis]|uniref:hypothetical protein n=1 Tax=Bacillus niameyensis TaxID=1522308 RepID=UPI00078037AD|nr:hypothetical protein [Bacillus niameyensis]